MDVTTPTTTTATETPPRTQPNGFLKRHVNHHAAPCSATFKECLKNHAASLGGHALDGCGEFMPTSTSTLSDPTFLKCAACGCHRNFHRRESDEAVSPSTIIEYRSHHRHQLLPPVAVDISARSPGSQSPPPISSTYYPGSTPHMLLALSGGHAEPNNINNNNTSINMLVTPSNPKKRFRTKFTQDQKDKMYELAEKIGWKMQKSSDDLVNGICAEIGVERGIFKVWMHNNKISLGKRSANPSANDPTNHTLIELDQQKQQHQQPLQFGSNESNAAPTNASSSSS